MGSVLLKGNSKLVVSGGVERFDSVYLDTIEYLRRTLKSSDTFVVSWFLFVSDWQQYRTRTGALLRGIVPRLRLLRGRGAGSDGDCFEAE